MHRDSRRDCCCLHLARAKSAGQTDSIASAISARVAIAFTWKLCTMRTKYYPGSYDANNGSYAWMQRIFSYAANDRQVFFCPAAPSDAAWDTNVNSTLGQGGKDLNGNPSPWMVTPNSRFSIGYNDWGLGQNSPAGFGTPASDLGLGGDIDGGVGQPPMKDSKVVAPARMINYACTRALPVSQDSQSWEANLDPTDTQDTAGTGYGGQIPSNRHNYKTDVGCCDGHVEIAVRNQLVDPTIGAIWRSRWNNDNQPHNEITWPPLAPGFANQLDPSY